MGDNGRFYLKLVKATLKPIVMLGHHERGTMDMLRGTMDPIIGINVHGAPFSENIYIFNFTIPKMKISTIKYYFFIFNSTIKMC